MNFSLYWSPTQMHGVFLKSMTPRTSLPLSASAFHVSGMTTSHLRCPLSSSFLSVLISLQKHLLLSCDPLYLLFRILATSPFFFGRFKFNVLALSRKENRGKSSYLCNSFVMDQITKMNVQVQPIIKKKKKFTSQPQIHTEGKDRL